MRDPNEILKERMNEVHRLVAKGNFTPEQQGVICELLELYHKPLSNKDIFRLMEEELKDSMANLDAADHDGLMELSGEKKMLDKIRRRFI